MDLLNRFKTLILCLSLSVSAYGAMEIYVGDIDTINGGTTQSVTGLGFEPKLIIFTSARDNISNSVTANLLGSFGVSNSTVNISIAGYSDDGVGTSDAVQYMDTNAALHDRSSGSRLKEMYVQSMDADGFTMYFTDLDTAGNDDIQYMAIGGDDITNVDIATFTIPSSGADIVISGLGYEPDMIMLFSGSATALDSEQNSQVFSIGFATAVGAQASMSSYSRDGAGTSDTSRWQESGLILTAPGSSQSAYMACSLKSIDSGGFTLEVSTPPGSDTFGAYVTFKGGQYGIMRFDANTTSEGTGNESYTGLGFQGSGLLGFSFGAPTTTNPRTNNEFIIGFATSATMREWTIFKDIDNQATMDSVRGSGNNGFIAKFNTSGSNIGLVDFVSFDSDGITVDYDVVSTTSREIFVMVFGDAVATPATGFKRRQIIITD